MPRRASGRKRPWLVLTSPPTAVIKFLRYEANAATVRSGAASDAVQAAARRLDEWVVRITANSQALAALSGVQEWAYESPVDGSGQPFKIAIPTDYDPAHPAPLSIRLHG